MRILLVLLLLSSLTQAKILIFTYAYNRPDFIEIQHNLFQKFLNDDYEFVVFNDASNGALVQSIDQMCGRLGLRSIRIPQEIHNRPYLKRWPRENFHNPSVRNCNVVQYSLNEYGFAHDDVVWLVDSDLFLMKEFSIRDYLKGYDLVGSKIGWGWLWIGCLFLDMRSMPNKKTFNVNCGRVDDKPVDAGGHTILYMRNNPDAAVKLMAGYHYVGGPLTDVVRLTAAGFNQYDTQFLAQLPTGINIEYLESGLFLHYRGGTNWDNKSGAYHHQKTSLLQGYVNQLLQS